MSIHNSVLNKINLCTVHFEYNYLLVGCNDYNMNDASTRQHIFHLQLDKKESECINAPKSDTKNALEHVRNIPKICPGH